MKGKYFNEKKNYSFSSDLLLAQRGVLRADTVVMIRTKKYQKTFRFKNLESGSLSLKDTIKRNRLDIRDQSVRLSLAKLGISKNNLSYPKLIEQLGMQVFIENEKYRYYKPKEIKVKEDFTTTVKTKEGLKKKVTKTRKVKKRTEGVSIKRENWKGKYVSVARDKRGRILSWNKWSSKKVRTSRTI